MTPPPSGRRCHVCGLDLGDFAPWGGDGKSPTFAICDCCGVEYGYEDCTEAGVLQARERWIAEGGKWWRPAARPEGWSLRAQLERLPRELPVGIKRRGA